MVALAGWSTSNILNAEDRMCSAIITKTDGKEDIVLENKFLRLVLGNPGGRCKSLFYKKAQKNLTFVGNSGFEGLFIDRLWKNTPTDYKDYSTADYFYEVENPGPDEATAHFYLTNVEVVPFLQLHKRITIFKDKSFIKVSYQFRNPSESMVALDIGAWFHQLPGVDGECNTYYTPNADGVRSLVSSSQKTGDTFFFNEPVRGWSGVVSNSKCGLGVEVDYRQLLFFLNWFHDDRLANLEWALEKMTIAPGTSCETEFYLVPFANMSSPVEVAHHLVCAIEATDRLSKPESLPITCRLHSAELRELNVQLRYKVLPSQEWVNIRNEKLRINADEEKVVGIQLAPEKQGTYVVGCLVKDGANEFLVAEKPIIVGKESGKYALSPLEKREIKKDKNGQANLIEKPSEEIETPHVKWAKPYYKGKVKAFILTAFPNQREIVELAQRLDLDFETSIVENYWGAGLNFFTPHGHKLSIPYIYQDIQKKLDVHYDVILIAGIKWSFFPAAVRQGIIKQVQEGTGLVYVCPVETPEELQGILGVKLLFQTEPGSFRQGSGTGKWEKAKDSDVTNGIPFSLLPETTYYKYDVCGTNRDILARIDGDPLLVTGKHGAGRTAVLTYLSTWVRPDGEFNAGITPYDAQNKDLDYYFSWVSKIMLWVAQKAPHILVNEIKTEGTSLLLAIANQGKEEGVKISWQIRDKMFHLENEGEKDILLPASISNIELPLPHLKIGTHSFNCVVKTKQGKVITWASTSLNITGPIRIENVSLEKEVYQRNESPVIKVLLSDSAPDYTVKCSIKDNYGRLLQRDQKDLASASLGFAFNPVKDLLTTYAWVEVELIKKQDNPVQKEHKRFTIVSSNDWDDFEIVMWIESALLKRSYLLSYCNEQLKSAGITAALSVPPAGPIAESNLKWFPIGAGGIQDVDSTAWQQQKKNYLVTKDKKCLLRNPCLNDPAYLLRKTSDIQTSVQKMADYAPVGYTMADENYVYHYSDPLDICFCRYCLSAMREWLKNQYGSLDVLNKEWETHFQTWEEVMPMSFEEVRTRESMNYSPWADHRSFMERTFAQTWKTFYEALAKADPHGKMGISGPFPPGAYTAYDYWKLKDCFGFVHSYGTENRREFIRSFMNIPVGEWNGYGVKGDELYYNAWLSIFEGCKFLSYWYPPVFFKPDLSNWPAGDDLKRLNLEFGSGLGKLIMHLKLSRPEVAIHYSQSSIHASYVLKREDVFKSNCAGYSKALQELQLPHKFVSYEEIENGMLVKHNYKALILPYSTAISPKEADNIKQFVNAGGMIIGDLQTGIMDDHCKTLTTGLLDDVFGIKRENNQVQDGPSKAKFVAECPAIKLRDQSISGKLLETGIKTTTGLALASEETGKTPMIILNNYGKGKAVYLNSLAYSEYLFCRRNSKAPNLSLQCQRLQNLLSQIMRMAEVKSNVQIIALDHGESLPYCQTACFDKGGNHYVGIIRDYPVAKDNDQTIKKGKVIFQTNSHIYDIRNKRYCGRADTVETDFGPGTISFYGLLPYEVKGLSVKLPKRTLAQGEVLEYALKLKVSQGEAGEHVVRIAVLDPENKVVPYYSKTLLVKDGLFIGHIPLALNEKPGSWKIQAEEVISGKRGTTSFQVQ